MWRVPLFLVVCSTLGLSQPITKIDREAYDAVMAGKHAIHLSWPIGDYPQFDSLADVYRFTTPVIATVLGKQAAVEPIYRGDIRTYYLVRVDENIWKKPLPSFPNASVPVVFEALQKRDPKAIYLYLEEYGGSTDLGGITVTLDPSGPPLTVDARYLLFLTVLLDASTIRLRTDGGDVLKVVNDSLEGFDDAAKAPVSEFSGKRLAQVEETLRNAVH